MYLCGHLNPSGKLCEIACGRLEAGDIIVKVESTSTYRTTKPKLSFGKENIQLALGIYTRKEEARSCLDL